MKTHILRIWLYAVLCISFWTCKSSNSSPTPLEQLPPATQTGANTFGCLIDGKPWIPNGGGAFSGIKPISAVNGVENRFLVVSANANIADNSETLSICFNDYKVLGEKSLLFDTQKYPDIITPKNYGEYVKYFPSPQGAAVYSTTSVVGGKVNITRFDSNVLSGTFEFDAIDSKTGKIIKITNGRFDIK
jgi:hypothetical protein